MARHAVSLVLAVLYAANVCGDYTAQSVSTHIDTVLAEYDREVSPAARVLLTLTLDVRHAAVDDAAATMRVLADLKMSWNDTRLTWNASVWDGDSVLVSVERLWRPDVVLVNAAGVAAGDDGGQRARLSARGAVTAVRRLDVTVPVALDLAAWPRDEQTAVFKFASREHTSDELDLVIGEFKNAVIVECGAWEVRNVWGETWTYSRVEGGQRRVAAWRVRVARRSAALGAAATAVLLATDALLLAAAARPYPQRAPLAACAALLSAAWTGAAAAHVPAGRAAPVALGAAGAACCVAAAAVVGAALVTRLARRAGPPSAMLRGLISRASTVCASSPQSDCVGGESGAWAAAAELLDRVVVSLVVLAVFVLTVVYFAT